MTPPNITVLIVPISLGRTVTGEELINTFKEISGVGFYSQPNDKGTRMKIGELSPSSKVWDIGLAAASPNMNFPSLIRAGEFDALAPYAKYGSLCIFNCVLSDKKTPLDVTNPAKMLFDRMMKIKSELEAKFNQ